MNVFSTGLGLKVHPPQQVVEARVVAEGLRAMCPLIEMFLRVGEICGRENGWDAFTYYGPKFIRSSRSWKRGSESRLLVWYSTQKIGSKSLEVLSCTDAQSSRRRLRPVYVPTLSWRSSSRGSRARRRLGPVERMDYGCIFRKVQGLARSPEAGDALRQGPRSRHRLWGRTGGSASAKPEP